MVAHRTWAKSKYLNYLRHKAETNLYLNLTSVSTYMPVYYFLPTYRFTYQNNYILIYFMSY